MDPLSAIFLLLGTWQSLGNWGRDDECEMNSRWMNRRSIRERMFWSGGSECIITSRWGWTIKSDKWLIGNFTSNGPRFTWIYFRFQFIHSVVRFAAVVVVFSVSHAHLSFAASSLPASSSSVWRVRALNWLTIRGWMDGRERRDNWGFNIHCSQRRSSC